MQQFCRQPLSFQCVGHSLGEEAGVAFVIKMLQIATAAGLKMLARRLDMMRPLDQAAIFIQAIQRGGKGDMAAISGHAITFCGNTQDQVGIGSRGHKHSCKGAGSWSISISGVKAGPASCPALLCSHWPSHAAL